MGGGGGIDCRIVSNHLTSLISRFVCSWSDSNSGLQSNVRIGTPCKRGGILVVHVREWEKDRHKENVRKGVGIQ